MVNEQIMKLQIKPLSLWLAYNVIDPQYLQSLIPPSLTLSKLKLLNDDVKSEYKLLFNAYDVSSQWMSGHRVDIQTLAIDRNSNTPHLVVLECLSNTIQWDPKKGITLPNANYARNHQSGMKSKKYDFNLHVWNSNNRMVVRSDRAGKRKLQRRFAVDANLKCYFGNHDEGFEMDFDHDSIMKPVTLLNTTSVVNTFWNNVKIGIPTHAFIHEQEMIFDVDIKDYMDI